MYKFRVTALYRPLDRVEEQTSAIYKYKLSSQFLDPELTTIPVTGEFSVLYMMSQSC